MFLVLENKTVQVSNLDNIKIFDLLCPTFFRHKEIVSTGPLLQLL